MMANKVLINFRNSVFAAFVLALGYSNIAAAAWFPEHAFFRLDDAVIDTGGNTPTPPSDNSSCRYTTRTGSTSTACNVRVRKTWGFNHFFDGGLRLVTFIDSASGGWFSPSEDSLMLVTPYAARTRFCVANSRYWSLSIPYDCNGSSVKVSARIFGKPEYSSIGGIRGKAAGGIAMSEQSYADRTFNTFRNDYDANLIEKIGVGRYRVTMEGMGKGSLTADLSLKGFPHVQAALQPSHGPDYTARICKIDSATPMTLPNPRTFELIVQCYGQNYTYGPISRVNSDFVFSYEEPGDDMIVGVYSKSSSIEQHFNGVVEYEWSRKARGGTVTVTGDTARNPGDYIVRLPLVSATGLNVQITARSQGLMQPSYCSIGHWRAVPNATEVRVRCFSLTSTGLVAANSQFHLTAYGK